MDRRAFVALVSAYPTEVDARAELPADLSDAPYRGLWILPTYERPEVHVFTHQSVPDLLCAGWEAR